MSHERNIVNICVADAIGNREKPISTTIEITRKLPDFESLEEAEQYYSIDASRLATALFDSLPQGTRLRLLEKLLSLEIKNNGYFRGL